MIPEVDACWTCGSSIPDPVSIPLQEDGPRRVMVCRDCYNKYLKGDLKRESTQPHES